MSTYKSYHDEPEQNYEEDVQVHGGGVDGGKPASFSGGGGGGGNGGGGSEYLSGQNSDFNDLADTSLAIGFVALVIVRCVRRKRARAHRLTAALAVLYGLFGRPLLYAGALPSTCACVCVCVASRSAHACAAVREAQSLHPLLVRVATAPTLARNSLTLACVLGRAYQTMMIGVVIFFVQLVLVIGILAAWDPRPWLTTFYIVLALHYCLSVFLGVQAYRGARTGQLWQLPFIGPVALEHALNAGPPPMGAKLQLL